ncbi:MAG: carnitine dehydratase [Myxococcales bacterium]|nr:carnitine dehydratase [Myxococcales bacterium]
MSTQNSSNHKGPLNAVKVLDFSTLLPGPYATAMLVDLGAEVIRVESPTRVDLLKVLPPLKNGQSLIHLGLNRGKKSVAINLKTPEGLDLAKRLVSEADVLVEQFRPGVMSRLGLDYQTLSQVNPKLIYCSITGYGQSGPYAHRAGHDINYLALSGVASYSGRLGEGPRLSGVQIADIAGGSHPAVIAILAALFERVHSGQGRYLDISMSDGALALNALTASAAAHSEAPSYGETFLNSGTLYDYYQSSDGRWLSVGSLEPQFAQGLLMTLGHPEWFKESLYPPRQQAKLKHKLTQVFASKSFAEWCEVFDQVDCCVEPVLTLKEALEHPLFKNRGLVKTELIDETEFIYVASPLSTAFPETQVDLAHDLGQDTDEILGNLGLSEVELEELRSKKVIKSTK